MDWNNILFNLLIAGTLGFLGMTAYQSYKNKDKPKGKNGKEFKLPKVEVGYK